MWKMRTMLPYFPGKSLLFFRMICMQITVVKYDKCTQCISSLCMNTMECKGMQLILRCKGVRERTLQSGVMSWKISKFNRHLEGELWRPWASTCMNVCEVAQSCPTLCDPIDCSLPHSFVHGIFQARVLERVAISFSMGSSQPRDRTWVSRIVGRRFTIWATRQVLVKQYTLI